MTTRAAPFCLVAGAGRRFTLPARGHGAVKVDAATGGGALSVLELVLEPGAGPGEHVHTREHEVWYVLDGTFRFLLDGALVDCTTGGLAFGPRGVPHTFRNVGTEPGRLLVITGPAGIEEFFLAYDRLADGHGDAAALAAAARVGGLEFVGPPLAGEGPDPDGPRRGTRNGHTTVSRRSGP